MLGLKPLCFVLISLLPLTSGQYLPTWESLDARPLPQWYDESKIGIFVHWGVFSVPSYATEWFWFRWKTEKRADFVDFMNKNYKPNFTYADFANQFTAEFYDPKHWADIFKASGAKYVVLTTKHHEGYTLWPSKYSWNWNAMDVGPNRDLVGDLEKAIKGVGIRFGVYHSLFEWFNPLYLKDKAANFTTNTFVTTKSRRELEELVNNYKPDIIWSDGDGGPAEYWQSKEFLAWLYNQSPVKDSVVVNDRWGTNCSCKHGGFFNCHDGYNPGVLQKHKWENAMTINKHSWGYTRNEKLSDVRTTHELLTSLAQTVSCGGNILLNVGPTHDGRITPIYEERLRDLGSWLSINGEAIYNSKPWTHQNDTKTQNIWYTMNGKTVYSIVLFWPTNNQIELGSVPFTTVSSISLLGRTGNLEISSGTDGHTVVKFPVLNPDSKIKWTYVLKIATK